MSGNVSSGKDLASGVPVKMTDKLVTECNFECTLMEFHSALAESLAPPAKGSLGSPFASGGLHLLPLRLALHARFFVLFWFGLFVCLLFCLFVFVISLVNCLESSLWQSLHPMQVLHKIFTECNQIDVNFFYVYLGFNSLLPTLVSKMF